MMMYNMANMMAEDTGAYELRNPLNSGMRKTSGVCSLFSWKHRAFKESQKKDGHKKNSKERN